MRLRLSRLLLGIPLIVAVACAARPEAAPPTGDAVAPSVAALTVQPDGQSSVSEFELAARRILREHALDRSKFQALLRGALGAHYDATRAEWYRTQMVAENWSFMPDTHLVGPDVLGEAAGAYASSLDRVYMRQELPKDHPARLFIYLEEVGHFLDAKLNTADSPGDEGQLFRRGAFGEVLAAWERQEVLAANDHGTITVGGASVAVERFWGPGCFIFCGGGGGGGGGGKSPVDWTKVRNEMGEEMAKRGAHMLAYVNEGAGTASQYLVGRLEASYEATYKLMIDHKNTLVGLGVDLRRGFVLVSKGVDKIAKGDVKSGLGDFFEGLAVMAAEGPISALSSAALAHVSASQVVLGIEPVGTPLTTAERTYLRHVFRQAVDLGAVTIKEGFAGLFSLNDRAFTLDNTIYFKKKPRSDKALMVHEVTHVWQFQNQGASYKAEALAEQAIGDGYNWRKGLAEGKSWAEFGQEQQGKFFHHAYEAGFFGSGIYLDAETKLDLSAFAAQSWASVSQTNSPFASRASKSFDGDARADLMFFEPSSKSLHLARSSGTGLAVGSEWCGANMFGWNKDRYYKGDFNGDGKVDLGYYEIGDNSFYVSLSDGTRCTPATAWIGTNWFGNHAGQYVVGDFNGDGKDDLGFFEPGDASFHVTTSTGTGFWGPGTGVWTQGWGHSAGSFLGADLNGDRKTDLLFVEPGDHTVHVRISDGETLFGAGSGRWIAPDTFGHHAGRYFIADFDGDARDDLGFFEPGDQTFHVALSRSIGFHPGSRWVGPLQFGWSVDGYLPADYNGDGRADLGYFEPGDNTFHVTLSTGAGFFAPGGGVWVRSKLFGHTAGRHYSSSTTHR